MLASYVQLRDSAMSPTEALERIMNVWGLSASETARLLGVSRQAVQKWRRGGVPGARVIAIADLAAATDLLVRYLKSDRIPAVVRRDAPALGGRSLTTVVREEGTAAALVACRTMFDFRGLHA